MSEGWITVYDPPRLMCLGEPLEVKAGSRHTHAMEVRGHDPQSSHHPRWESAPIHGEYRLVWDVRSGPDADAVRIPLELRLSNTFRIEAPAPG
ncbi:MAG: hypothetical protein WDZ89_01520 [Gemmatimonadota bacterium]